VAVLAALTALTAACGAVTHTARGSGAGGAGGAVLAAASAGTISETGSSLLYPLIRAWAAGYQKQTPGVTVTTASTSSGTGITAATDDTADLGASDAYLSSGDLVKKPALRNIPLAVSAQTVVYHLPDVSGSAHVKLNGTILAGIYSGAITMRDDPRITAVNPDVTLPALKIVPVERSDSSADTFLFTSYLSTQDSAWNDTTGYGTIAAWPKVAAARLAKGSLSVLSTCESTPGCVAYNGISYLSQARAGGLGEAELANAAGHCTLPDAATIQASAASFVSLTPVSRQRPGD
jgi:phosphate transport system substrate-binding protein